MLIRLSQPAGLAVELDDLKNALGVDGNDRDATLEALIRSETQRYEDFTGRIMLPTDLEFRQGGWQSPIVLPAFPIAEISAVAYLDASGVEQELPDTDWYEVARTDGVHVYLADGFARPSLDDRLIEPVRVRFTAGYDAPGASGSGDDPELVASDQDRQAITLMVSWIFDRGEPIPLDTLRLMAGNRRIFR